MTELRVRKEMLEQELEKLRKHDEDRQANDVLSGIHSKVDSDARFL